MELISQPFTGQLGSRLIGLLESPLYHTVNIAVAFARNSGVLRMKDSLEKFRARGGTVNVYVGVDLGGTSYEALTALLRCTNSLNVVHSEGDQTFHPKIYQFLGPAANLIVVGSHNLTGGGLWTNIESSVLLSAGPPDIDGMRILAEMDEYIGKLTSLPGSFMPIVAQGDIEKLLQHGYVTKEVAEQVRRAKATARSGSNPRLFGKGAPAMLPRLASSASGAGAPAPAPSAPATPAAPAVPAPTPLSGEDQTIWFETRAMTGGSRNILDLSMKSLVERGDPTGTTFDTGDPKFMRGAVEFFGVDPSATNHTKDITLNFEGVDYAGNSILFPDGDSANGTWRLQIKGVSTSGVKITDAFRAKGSDSYLVNKVITFTKVHGDYYSLAVFPISDLVDFADSSRILARNGSSAKARQLGIL